MEVVSNGHHFFLSFFALPGLGSPEPLHNGIKLALELILFFLIVLLDFLFGYLLKLKHLTSLCLASIFTFRNVETILSHLRGKADFVVEVGGFRGPNRGPLMHLIAQIQLQVAELVLLAQGVFFNLFFN